MSEKYCPAGKCECEHWELKSEVPFLGLFHCRQIGDSLLGCDIYQLKFCPWPSRQAPKQISERSQALVDAKGAVEKETTKSFWLNFNTADLIERIIAAIEKLEVPGE